MRTESSFDELMAEVQLMAEQLDTTTEKPRVSSHRSIYRANSDEDLDATGYYRVNVFYPAIDVVRLDLEERFGSDHSHTDAAGQVPKTSRRTHHTQTFCLSGILPKRVTGVSWGDIREGWQLFQPALPECSEDDAKAEELQVWAAIWRRSQGQAVPNSAVAALDECDAVTFPTIHRLLQVRPYLHFFRTAVLTVLTCQIRHTYSAYPTRK